MNSAARTGASVIAIMNPGTGPGTTRQTSYVNAISALHAAGGKVYGYIPSGYSGQSVAASSSCRPSGGATTYSPQDLVTCAQRYRDNYGVDGIFVDEMGATGTVSTSASITFYHTLYAGLKNLNSAWAVVGNPGITEPPEQYLVTATMGADTLVTYEGPAASYFATPATSYASRYAAKRFASLLYNAPVGFDFLSALNRAQANNVAYIYVTDDTCCASGQNPWDRLPSNWESQVATVNIFNVGK